MAGNKLDVKLVKAVSKALKTLVHPEPITVIARTHGISIPTVEKIRNGKHWSQRKEA